MDARADVWCWGGGGALVLGGDPALDGSQAPLPMPLNGAGAVAARNDVTCAADSSGQVWCWGRGTGASPWRFEGRNKGRYVPLQIALPGAASVIDTEGAWACASLVGGAGVACWTTDWAAPVVVRVPGTEGARTVSINDFSGCLIDADSEVQCWDTNELWAPEDGVALHEVPGVNRAHTLDAMWGSVCATKADGRVSCWTQDVIETGNVETAAGLTDATQAAVGYDHTCALRRNGAVACWGKNEFGQIGDGTLIDRPNPVTLQGLDGVIDLDANALRTCALRVDGRVFCWGGDYQQASTPTEQLRVQRATALSMGEQHMCLTVGGQLYCQGDNSWGQLARNPGWLPVQVQGLE
jgi:alpha-tubulin suppressor-like RCC1 family protein